MNKISIKYCKTNTKRHKTESYVKLFIVVVQEDKLRVGPRNVLHHQVVAEVVIKDLCRKETLQCLLKHPVRVT